MKKAPLTSVSVSSANPARMAWKQPDSSDSSGVKIRNAPSGRRLRKRRSTMTCSTASAMPIVRQRKRGGRDRNVKREFPAGAADREVPRTGREAGFEHRADGEQQRGDAVATRAQRQADAHEPR